MGAVCWQQDRVGHYGVSRIHGNDNVVGVQYPDMATDSSGDFSFFSVSLFPAFVRISAVVEGEKQNAVFHCSHGRDIQSS